MSPITKELGRGIRDKKTKILIEELIQPGYTTTEAIQEYIGKRVNDILSQAVDFIVELNILTQKNDIFSSLDQQQLTSSQSIRESILEDIAKNHLHQNPYNDISDVKWSEEYQIRADHLKRVLSGEEPIQDPIGIADVISCYVGGTLENLDFEPKDKKTDTKIRDIISRYQTIINICENTPQPGKLLPLKEGTLDKTHQKLYKRLEKEGVSAVIFTDSCITELLYLVFRTCKGKVAYRNK